VDGEQQVLRLTGESDPLPGNRESIPGCPVTAGFTMAGDSALRRRVSGLQQFVTVRGGAYFSWQVYASYAISPQLKVHRNIAAAIFPF